MKRAPTKKGTKRPARRTSSGKPDPRGRTLELPKQKSNRDPLGEAFPGYHPKYCRMIVEFAKRPEGHFKAFSAFIGCDPQTIFDWDKKYPEFSKAKALAKLVNERAMFDLGMRGMNGKLPTGAWQAAWIFAMKARHGWRDDGTAADDDGENDVDFDFER